MTEDKVIEDFFEMFPDCPNPKHQPMVVQHLVRLFKHIHEEREVEEEVAVLDKANDDEETSESSEG